MVVLDLFTLLSYFAGRRSELSPPAEKKLVWMVGNSPETIKANEYHELKAPGILSTIKCALHLVKLMMQSKEEAVALKLTFSSIQAAGHISWMEVTKMAAHHGRRDIVLLPTVFIIYFRFSNHKCTEHLHNGVML